MIRGSSGTGPARFPRRAGFLVLTCLMPGVMSCSSRSREAEWTQREPAGPTRHQVAMHGVRFEPDSLVVSVGDTVAWHNRDFVPHTSTANDSAWGSGTIAPDSSWSTVIRAPGVHPYHCVFHPAMRAKLIARSR